MLRHSIYCYTTITLESGKHDTPDLFGASTAWTEVPRTSSLSRLGFEPRDLQITDSIFYVPEMAVLTIWTSGTF